MKHMTQTEFYQRSTPCYAELCDGPYERVLYQTFSLPGQARDRSPAM